MFSNNMFMLLLLMLFSRSSTVAKPLDPAMAPIVIDGQYENISTAVGSLEIPITVTSSFDPSQLVVDGGERMIGGFHQDSSGRATLQFATPVAGGITFEVHVYYGDAYVPFGAAEFCKWEVIPLG